MELNEIGYLPFLFEQNNELLLSEENSEPALPPGNSQTEIGRPKQPGAWAARGTHSIRWIRGSFPLEGPRRKATFPRPQTVPDQPSDKPSLAPDLLE